MALESVLPFIKNSSSVSLSLFMFQIYDESSTSSFEIMAKMKIPMKMHRGILNASFFPTSGTLDKKK